MKTLLLSFVTCVMLSRAVAQDSGPIVSGRPLSFWLRTWVEKTTNIDQRVEAQRAFEQAGTNVIP
jgi:hypothetical protein